MTPVVLAVLLALVAFPVVLVFGPAHFPWSMLVLVGLGLGVGLAIPPRGRQFSRVLGLAVLMVAVVFGVLTLTSNIAVDVSFLGSDPAVLRSAPVWLGSLLLPMLLGVATGAALRARWGIRRAAAVGVLSLFAILLLGTGLAFAFAPPEVANAPRCADSPECPRTWCARMAERTRLLAIERVTAFDGSRITCTYTAWGGIYIGRTDVGGREGWSWTDGAWPRILSGR